MVTPPLVIRVSPLSMGLLVTPPLVIRVTGGLGLLVGDLSCVCEESASSSADASASNSVSSSSLKSGRCMDRYLHVLMWGLPCM